MKEKLVAKAYAKSLIELGEMNKVDLVKEITDFSELISGCNHFENLLFSGVFTNDEKKVVLVDVFKKSSFSSMFKNFIFILLDEKRLDLFPRIFKEMIVIDDDRKGFIKGTIEGAEDKPSAEVIEKIKKYIEEKIKKKPFLEYVKNMQISAGYKVTAEDLQLDATLENQFEHLKENILQH